MEPIYLSVYLPCLPFLRAFCNCPTDENLAALRDRFSCFSVPCHYCPFQWETMNGVCYPRFNSGASSLAETCLAYMLALAQLDNALNAMVQD